MLLIVSRKKSDATSIANMIRFSGILCYPATPAEAFSEIGTIYRAVVLLDPDTLADARDYVKRLHSYLSNIPVFALYSDKVFYPLDCFDASYSSAAYSAGFASKLAEYAKAKGYEHIGDYRLAGINASPDLPTVSFFDRPINLTKTEAMILRLLMRSYPLPLKPKGIIKYVYKPSDAPELSSIRAHICSINKKFKEYTDGNIIRAVDDSGYVIYTPEIRERYGI